MPWSTKCVFAVTCPAAHGPPASLSDADGLIVVQCCREVSEKYPEIAYEEVIIDNCCMMVNPQDTRSGSPLLGLPRPRWVYTDCPPAIVEPMVWSVLEAATKAASGLQTCLSLLVSIATAYDVPTTIDCAQESPQRKNTIAKQEIWSDASHFVLRPARLLTRSLGLPLPLFVVATPGVPIVFLNSSCSRLDNTPDME